MTWYKIRNKKEYCAFTLFHLLLRCFIFHSFLHKDAETDDGAGQCPSTAMQKLTSWYVLHTLETVPSWTSWTVCAMSMSCSYRLLLLILTTVAKKEN